jgi:O-acetyl-ADP-ribose deacetylase
LTMASTPSVVNAADPSLLGGTGLDGAIHRAAGGGLLGECRPLGGCRPGEAKMTKGWSLPVKHVIHTVGPVWNGGTADEQATLAACYANSLELAASKGLRTIAFPSISTGTKGFPLEEAAFIAAKTALEFLAKKTSVALVIFCTFTPEQTNAARRGLAKAIT